MGHGLADEPCGFQAHKRGKAAPGALPHGNAAVQKAEEAVTWTCWRMFYVSLAMFFCGVTAGMLQPYLHNISEHVHNIIPGPSVTDIGIHIS